jgi:phage shock protein PspC (stress-responsive transcriptional regulator)
MKRTFTINISSNVFHIEEDAYEVLQKYMINLKNHFGESEEGKEIESDIEARIAEIFAEKSSGGKNAVTLEWVNLVMATIGTPESITDEMGDEEPQVKRKRRLYRDPQETVLGGVCGGLAAYFNLDPVITRIIFVILTLITTGVGVLAYIILWIAVPQAINTAQRLEMRGQEVTVKNIEKFIQEEAQAVKESYNKFRKSGFFTKREKV